MSLIDLQPDGTILSKNHNLFFWGCDDPDHDIVLYGNDGFPCCCFSEAESEEYLLLGMDVRINENRTLRSVAG